jgi:hypothetical protein
LGELNRTPQCIPFERAKNGGAKRPRWYSDHRHGMVKIYWGGGKIFISLENIGEQKDCWKAFRQVFATQVDQPDLRSTILKSNNGYAQVQLVYRSHGISELARNVKACGALPV